MSCGIYKWTNPSGKSYIGQSVNLEKRKQEFINNKLYTTNNKSSLTVIDKARKKYPDFEQWTYEILEFCNPNELNDKEQYYINLFDTFKNGYNETSGGGQSFEFSDETKEKIGKANKGKTLSDEHKEKLRQAHIGKTLSDEHKENIGKGNKGKIPWNKGKHRSQESLKKLSESLKGHIGYNRKQVDQYSLDGTFIKTWDSILQVEKELGYKNGGICKCCKGKQKTSNGFIWRYHN